MLQHSRRQNETHRGLQQHQATTSNNNNNNKQQNNKAMLLSKRKKAASPWAAMQSSTSSSTSSSSSESKGGGAGTRRQSKRRKTLISSSSSSVELSSDVAYGWKKHGTLLVLHNASINLAHLPAKAAVKIAAFDDHGTLTLNASGRIHATSVRDWQWLSEKRPMRLKELHDAGWLVCVLSNAQYLTKQHVCTRQTTGRLNQMANGLGFSPTCLLATTSDEQRKPCTGMWDSLEALLKQDGFSVDYKHSFYVGDAAGRTGDYSCKDRQFASNAGIKFQTPEQFFDGAKTTAKFWSWRSIDPYKLPVLSKPEYTHVAGVKCTLGPVKQQELIVFCGPPCSGQTTLAKTYFPTYTRVPWRGLYTTAIKARYYDEIATVLRENNTTSYIVDYCNATPDNRVPYIAVAKRLGVFCRVIDFKTKLNVLNHLNWFRFKTMAGNPYQKLLPPAAFERFFRYYQKPSLHEGMDSIAEVPVSVSKPLLDDARLRKLFYQRTPALDDEDVA
jgi:bifunctional polynucleotide phosphatase/kinase